MSQIKFFKRDLINLLKCNLDDNNIYSLIDEIKINSDLEMRVQVEKKSYMW